MAMPEPPNDEMLQHGIGSSSPCGLGGVLMRRRQFLSLLGGAVAWPLTVRAQVLTNRPLIVYFAGGSQWNARNYLAAVQESLQELGYVEGRNFDLVARYGDG